MSRQSRVREAELAFLGAMSHWDDYWSPQELALITLLVLVRGEQCTELDVHHVWEIADDTPPALAVAKIAAGVRTAATELTRPSRRDGRPGGQS